VPTPEKMVQGIAEAFWDVELLVLWLGHLLMYKIPIPVVGLTNQLSHNLALPGSLGVMKYNI
jgi:hypothetical protein